MSDYGACYKLWKICHKTGIFEETIFNLDVSTICIYDKRNLLEGKKADPQRKDDISKCKLSAGEIIDIFDEKIWVFKIGDKPDISD